MNLPEIRTKVELYDIKRITKEYLNYVRETNCRAKVQYSGQGYKQIAVLEKGNVDSTLDDAISRVLTIMQARDLL